MVGGFRVSVLAAVVLLSGFLRPAFGRQADANGIGDFFALDEHLKAEAAAERFSGVVLVAHAGRPVFFMAYGYADRANDRPNEPDTRFNIGSLNKLFTEVAILQLIDAGKLHADDTIGKYLPAFPADVRDKVTVQHLLDHRSGWSAYWENPAYLERRNELRTIDDYMAFIKGIPLEFEPGTQQRYSNTGFEVLGAIIEKVTGETYYDYIREHVYEPAGMHATDAYDNDHLPSNTAVGYTEGGYRKNNHDWLPAKGTAAGGGYSTAEDMLRFAMALREGKLVSPERANQFLGGAFAGGAPGVNAEIDFTAAGDHTIIVVSNFDPPTAGEVARLIGGVLEQQGAGNSYRIGVGFDIRGGDVAINVVSPGGPGERAGLKPGDVVISVDDEPVKPDTLVSLLDPRLKSATPIKFGVQRDGKTLSIAVTPEARSSK